MRFVSAGLTDIGKIRSHNEDSFVDSERNSLYLVADGMGGHQAGDFASRTAATLISTFIVERYPTVAAFAALPSPENRRAVLGLVEAAIQRAGRGIHAIAREQPGRKGMGTTVSMLLLAGAGGFIAHVGDSRIYLVRQGRTHQLTDDHSLVQEEFRRGRLAPDQVADFPYQNVVTRGVGLFESVVVDSLFLELMPDDLFLLCTDGLHRYLPSDELAAAANDDPARLVRDLVDTANRRGGRDNISLVAVRVQGAAEERYDAGRRLELLRQIPLFSGLTYPELARILAAGRTVEFRAGERIITEDDVDECLYVVLNGGVEVFKNGVYLTSIAPGGHFGEMSLIDRHPRSATVDAVRDTTVLMFEKEPFQNLLGGEPVLANKVLSGFLSVLNDRLRETTRAYAESRRRMQDGTDPVG